MRGEFSNGKGYSVSFFKHVFRGHYVKERLGVFHAHVLLEGERLTRRLTLKQNSDFLLRKTMYLV